MAPMITRGKDEDDTICHDAHTMALRRANRTHEFNTIMNLRKVFGHFFGMPKILPSLTKLLPKPEKLNRSSYDGFRCPHEWPDVYTIRPEFEHFHNRVSIWCQVRDSVTPALERERERENERERERERERELVGTLELNFTLMSVVSVSLHRGSVD